MVDRMHCLQPTACLHSNHNSTIDEEKISSIVLRVDNHIKLVMFSVYIQNYNLR